MIAYTSQCANKTYIFTKKYGGQARETTFLCTSDTAANDWQITTSAQGGTKASCSSLQSNDCKHITLLSLLSRNPEKNSTDSHDAGKLLDAWLPTGHRWSALCGEEVMA